MIYQPPEGESRIATRTSRELALGLVIMSLLAAAVASLALGAACDGRTGWPCLRRHAEVHRAASATELAIGAFTALPPGAGGAVPLVPTPVVMPTALLAPTAFLAPTPSWPTPITGGPMVLPTRELDPFAAAETADAARMATLAARPSFVTVTPRVIAPGYPPPPDLGFPTAASTATATVAPGATTGLAGSPSATGSATPTATGTPTP